MRSGFDPTPSPMDRAFLLIKTPMMVMINETLKMRFEGREYAEEAMPLLKLGRTRYKFLRNNETERFTVDELIGFMVMLGIQINTFYEPVPYPGLQGGGSLRIMADQPRKA